MNILGIIAEYNPLHNGHVYHIQEAKKISKADYVIVIMSGSFTQQGNISVINKFERANLAIEAGADLVLELPTIYATSSTESFSKGAIDILNSLGCITHLAFGSECNNIQTLENIARKVLENRDKLIEEVNNKANTGVSAPKLSSDFLQNILTASEYNEISKSNNILAIEYIKSLMALKSNIKPLLVQRVTSNHSDQLMHNLSIFASSSAIRNELTKSSEISSNIKKCIPEYTLDCLIKNSIRLNEDIYHLLKYKIIILGKIGLKNIKEVSEGIENRLIDKLNCSSSYDEYIANVKCKRYTVGRIKRICVNILLNITKKLDNKICDVKYARILKVNKNSIELLSILDSASIPVITSLKNIKINKIDSKIIESLNLDILATNISELNNNINIDYTNNII